MKKIVLILGLLSCILSLTTKAGSGDPVAWTLIPASGFPNTLIGDQSQVSYTLSNKLPFPITLSTDYIFQGGTFGVHDNCKNRTLAPHGVCTINFTFTPQGLNAASLNLIIKYNNNQVPLPSLTAQGIGKPMTETVSGAISGLPPSLHLNPLTQPVITITYTNTGQTMISGNAGDNFGADIITSSDPTKATVAVTNNNCGTPIMKKDLHPGASCTVEARVTPVGTDLGVVGFTGLFSYDGTKTSTVKAGSVVETGSGSCQIDGSTYLPLPATVYQYSDNMVKFRFNNNCNVATGPLSGVGVTNSLGTNATTTVASSTVHACVNGQSIPAGGYCDLLASAIPNKAGTTMTVSAQVSSDGHTASAHSSGTVIANNTTQHTVHFINQCPFTVWYGIANGDGSPASSFVFSPDPTPGSQSATGAPSDSYKVAAQVAGQAPGTKDLAITQYTNGAIWPRTGCKSDGTDFACTTGMCNTLSSASGTCVVQGSPGLNQPANPYTKFEFTIVPTAGSDGVYDTSLINGMNVPVEVKGLGPTDSNAPFTCTGAGAVAQATGSTLGSCPWTFDPTFNGAVGGSGLSPQDLLWVSAGPDDACTTDNAGLSCGMAYNTIPNNAPINRRRGEFLGYWTVADFIGFSSAGQWGSVNLYNQYAYDTAMSTITQNTLTYGTGATFGDLLSCSPTANSSANTCNNPAITGPYSTTDKENNCCGCVPWNAANSVVPTNVNGDSCVYSNTDWTDTTGLMPGAVSPKNAIVWLKKACPTAYAYQFDDPSSSFTCLKDSAGAAMKTSYQITFCPGGQTGLPNGATEGRGVS